MTKQVASGLNGTLLGIAPMRLTLPLAGLMLTVLFVVMEPAATYGLDLPDRIIFWSLHVTVALLGILVASHVIRQAAFTRWRPGVSIVLAGVIGAFIVTPLFLLLEFVLPDYMLDVDDDGLDVFAARGPAHALVAEYLSVLPMFVTAWAAVNLPLFFPDSGNDGPDGADPGNDPNRDAGESRRELLMDPAKEQFFDKLPVSLGRDLVAISSDLHYLHVYTTAGRTMVIGSLRDAALVFADEGMLVHKSHWVRHCHVLRYAPGDGACCVMSTGIKVPVSRRRRAQVKAMYGDASTVRLKSVGGG